MLACCDPCSTERKDTGICQNAYDTFNTLKGIANDLKDFRKMVLGEDSVGEMPGDPICLEENIAMCAYMATSIRNELERIKSMF